MIDLPWLLPAPEDFRARTRALRKEPMVDPMEVIGLANFALDTNQLGQLAKLVAAHREVLRQSSLRPVKLAISASHTIDFLAEAIPATGLRHRLLAEVYSADFGQSAQALLDPQSELYAFAPDFVWLALDAQSLGLAQPLLDNGEAEAAVQRALDHAAALRDAARAHSSATVILTTLPTHCDTLFGNLDTRQPGSVRWMLQRFNARLVDEVARRDDLVFDMAALAETIGHRTWFDTPRWHDAKLPFALDAIPLCADHLCRLLAAAQGLSRKCLVLDLDNTLWGGVIGDDGLDGIVLGQGSGAGEAFLAVQHYAKALRGRGIILAVCSKNEEANARLPFREHEEMILQDDDIAMFVANWEDKASNLRHIAQSLNIGTDALVLLDDNPAERERVRQELPEVAVPEIGAEPSLYPGILAAAGYFEAIAFGDEDRARAEMYRANAARTGEMQKIGNLDDYLRSLDMVCSIRPFDAAGRSRIAQLINKSNQFNLTTRRYSEAEVQAIEADPEHYAVQVRLSDRFGDNGMIAVAIFDKAGEHWLCDTWLMSCRVLGRRVEEAVLAHVAEVARAHGAQRLVGEYLPSGRNALVEKHFERLGFDFSGDIEGGGTRWSLDLARYQPEDLPMVFETTGG